MKNPLFPLMVILILGVILYFIGKRNAAKLSQ